MKNWHPEPGVASEIHGNSARKVVVDASIRVGRRATVERLSVDG